MSNNYFHVFRKKRKPKIAFNMKQLGFLLLLFVCACNSVETPPRERVTAKVTGIKDGDTIEVLINGKSETIRLLGIDCPERKQAFGTKAKQFTSALCFGKMVTLESGERDQYKRLLATVFVEGKNINQELVKAGLAWRYKYSTDETLGHLESEARKQRLGLWADNNPVAPWNFRKKEKAVY